MFDIYASTAMSIILRFFPNGEFTQGIDTSKKRKPNNHQKSNLSTVHPSVVEQHEYLTNYFFDANGLPVNYYTPGQQFETRDGGIYTYLCEDSKGHHFAFESSNYVLADVIINEPIGVLIVRGDLSPLVHQLVESSPPPPKPSRKRLDSMTNNMARNIRNAVYLLEQEYGKDNLSFLTLTLPDLSAKDLSKVCDRWDYMTDELLKSLRKRCERYNMELEYVYCTEIQTKRLKLKHEYAPHLHIVFRGRNGRKSPWVITPKQIRKSWASIIARVVDHRNFITNALENLQRIKKSAARYLSKYLSKGKCRNSGTGSAENQIKLRTQWGGMARRLAHAVKARTTRLSSAYGDGGLVVHFTCQMDSYVDAGAVKYYKQGFIALSTCSITGMERGIKVCSGCLSIPSLEGGIDRIWEHFHQEQGLL
jgi:hypothetical protein